MMPLYDDTDIRQDKNLLLDSSSSILFTSMTSIGLGFGMGLSSMLFFVVAF